MIDMRTKFFAVVSVLAFSLYFVAPDDLKKVPIGTGIVYVILTVLCLLDSFSRHSRRHH